MTWLITSDLHLSDRPRDFYRFGLFKWLREMQAKHKVTETFILGDLTDYKDRHSATLVNQMVTGITSLHPPVTLLKGNHDFVDPVNPYFGFLNNIEGLYFVTQPAIIETPGLGLIPHCASQDEMNKAAGIMPPGLQAVFGHQLIEGAISESGSRLSGLRWPLVGPRAPKATYLGDIHRPQRLACGAVYVGSPYHVRFGDNFNPRVLLVKDGVETDLHYPAPRKWSITVTDFHHLVRAEGTQLMKGDQVKIELVLPREELHEAGERKKQIVTFMRELGAEVHGFRVTVPPTILTERAQLSPQARTYDEILTGFGKAEALSGNIMQVGRELIK